MTDVARLETGHTPSRKHPEYWGGDVPWIGIRDATGNHGQTIHKTAQYTNELGIRNSSARILPANTVCLSRTASVGYVVVMGVPMATSQDFVNWVCGPKLDYRFLKYILVGERNSFLRFASGTTHQTIYFPEVKAFHAALPDIDTQRSIADVLSALDDRITLLRETNATLEAIAHALFKSWFVDFDPVRTKMAGRAPEGMDEATAALFPDALEETELGVVPKGWLAAKLGAVIEQFGGVIQTGPFGSQLHASDYVERGTPVAMPKDLDQRRISEASVARVADEHVQRLAKHQLKAGDILFSRRGDVERHALITPVEQGWLCGTGCLLVRPGATWRWPTFLSMRLDTPAAKAWLVQHAVGATMPNLNTGILSSVPMLLPSIELMDRFEGVVAEFEKKRSENFAMIGTLASMRDALLPRLISGQLPLPEAQAQAQAQAQLEDALA